MESPLSTPMVFEQVLQYLSAFDLMACNCVSKSWNGIAQAGLAKKTYSNVSIEFEDSGEKMAYKVGCRSGKNQDHYTSYRFIPVHNTEDYREVLEDELEAFNDRSKKTSFYLMLKILFNCRVKSVYIGNLPLKLKNEEQAVRRIFNTFTTDNTELPINSLVCNYVDSYLLHFFNPKHLNFWSGDWDADWMCKSVSFVGGKMKADQEGDDPTSGVVQKIATAPFFSAIGAAHFNMDDCFYVHIKPRSQVRMDLYMKKLHRCRAQWPLKAWQRGEQEIDQYFYSYRFPRGLGDRWSVDEYTQMLQEELPNSEIVRDPLAFNPEANPIECRVLSVPNLAGTASLLVRVDYSSDPMLHRVLPRHGVIEMAGDSNYSFHSPTDGVFMFIEIGKQLHGRFIWPDDIC